MNILRIVLSGMLLLALFGCGGGQSHIIGFGESVFATQANLANTRHRILIATTRAPSDDPREFFSGERASSLSLGYVDVGVPPQRSIGEITRPPEGPPNPETDFVVSTPVMYQQGAELNKIIRDQFGNRSGRSNTALVFVHGYNTNFSSAVLRISQFVHDTGYTGIPILFSWASRAKTVDYVYDLNSALQSRYYLSRFNRELGETDVDHIAVFAHSMGNMAALESLRILEDEQDATFWDKLHGVVMASPDVDIDLFTEYLRRMPRTRNVLRVFVSGDDRALRVSQRIAGGQSRVGATDAQYLSALGIRVIDLSDIETNERLNHSKFADSPEVIRLFSLAMEGLTERDDAPEVDGRVTVLIEQALQKCDRELTPAEIESCVRAVRESAGG
ncbi:MAG: alpha/beta hydrolase [Pseudomonadota bacterium]